MNEAQIAIEVRRRLAAIDKSRQHRDPVPRSYFEMMEWFEHVEEAKRARKAASLCETTAELLACGNVLVWETTNAVIGI